MSWKATFLIIIIIIIIIHPCHHGVADGLSPDRQRLRQLHTD